MLKAVQTRCVTAFKAIAVLLLLCAAGAFGQQAAPTPLLHAHAHNDYEHPQPLFDALAHGFTSVEADIFLVGDNLLVGHSFFELRPERTLKALYLDPLRKLVKENGGRVEPGWPQLTLLIDVKTEGASTYRALEKVLASYPDLFTVFGPGGVKEGPVVAIISGNRPRQLMLSEKVRYAAYDGRLSDLNSALPASFMPLISDNWRNVFSWQGVGLMPSAEKAKLDKMVKTVHAHGRRLRFWNTPDVPGSAREAVWEELLNSSVDLINTDDLAGLQKFLLAHKSTAPHN
jgi:glycerophosphoryl diester phosphodiesterase